MSSSVCPCASLRRGFSTSIHHPLSSVSSSICPCASPTRLGASDHRCSSDCKRPSFSYFFLLGIHTFKNPILHFHFFQLYWCSWNRALGRSGSTACQFDTPDWKLITTTAWANTAVTSHHYHLSFVVKTLKIDSLSSFEVYHTILLTVITTIYITAPELTHLLTEPLHPWATFSFSPPWQPLVTITLLSGNPIFKFLWLSFFKILFLKANKV